MNPAPTPIVIKKYENRRLYDTTNSRYINLDEVAQLVQDGRELRVVDANTGEDLTRLVLTQIIMEQAKTPKSAFPLDVLRQMVVASGKATQENTLQYMKAVLDMYQNAFRAMSPPMNPFEFMTRSPEPVAEPTGNSARGSQDPGVDELKQRVRDLESMVSRLAGKKRTRKAAKKKE